MDNSKESMNLFVLRGITDQPITPTDMDQFFIESINKPYDMLVIEDADVSLPNEQYDNPNLGVREHSRS